MLQNDTDFSKIKCLLIITDFKQSYCNTVKTA